MRKTSQNRCDAHKYATKVWCGFLSVPNDTLEKVDLRKLLDDSQVYRLSYDSFLAGLTEEKLSTEENREEAHGYAFQRWAEGLSPEAMELSRGRNRSQLCEESRIYRVSLRGFLAARGELAAKYAPYG
jgi:hypothetical protein